MDADFKKGWIQPKVLIKNDKSKEKWVSNIALLNARIIEIEKGQSHLMRTGRIKHGFEISDIDIRRSLIVGISHDLNKHESTIGLTSF